MGAAFYLPLLHVFGLNPAPYQAAILALLGINAYLAYRLAKALGARELVAGLTALVVCYHPGLTSLQYNTDLIYDVWCFLFFVTALLRYVSVRSGRGRFGFGNAAVFLLLYLCALGSKEMAVTLPLLIVAYECIYFGAPKSYTEARARFSGGFGAVLLLAFVMGAIYTAGKVFGPNTLAAIPGYRPLFTLDRVMAFQQGSLHDLLCVYPKDIHLIGALIIWVCFTYLAFRRKRPILRFAWAWALVAPIPIEFLEGRFQGELYIPMMGWAIAAAAVLVDIATYAANFVSDEPLFRLAGKRALFAGLIAGAVVLWTFETNYLCRTCIKPSAANQGILARKVIKQLDDLHPNIRPHSVVAFLDDPCKPASACGSDYDMYFIMELWLRDPTIEVPLQRQNPLPPEAIAKAEHIFSFRGDQLLQIR